MEDNDGTDKTESLQEIEGTSRGMIEVTRAK